MLLPEQSPDDGDVFDYYIERDRGQRAADARGEPQHAEPVQRERFDDAEDVHVDVDGTDESTREVDDGRAGDRAQGGEDDVGRR